MITMTTNSATDTRCDQGTQQGPNMSCYYKSWAGGDGSQRYIHHQWYNVSIWESFENSSVMDLVHPFWFSFPPTSYWVHMVFSVFVALVATFSTLGNMLVFFVFLRTKTLRYSGIYTSNLAFSDFLSPMLTYYLFTATSFYQTWVFGKLACELYGFIQGFFGLMSIVTLAVISAERHYVIKHPFRARDIRFVHRASATAFIWVYCFLVASPPLFGWSRYGPAGFLTSCCFDYISRTWLALSFIMYLFTMGFVIPVSIIVYSYVNIFLTVHRSEMNSNITKTAGGRGGGGGQQAPSGGTRVVVKQSSSFLSNGKGGKMETEVVCDLASKEGSSNGIAIVPNKNNNNNDDNDNKNNNHIQNDNNNNNNKNDDKHKNNNTINNITNTDNKNTNNSYKSNSDNKIYNNKNNTNSNNSNISNINNPLRNVSRRKKPSAQNKVSKQIRKDVKTARITLIVILTFIIAWTPYAVVALMGQFAPFTWINPFLSMSPAIFAKTSTLYNPVIYAFKDTKFKAAMNSLFPIFGKLQAFFRQNQTEFSDTSHGSFCDDSLARSDSRSSIPMRGVRRIQRSFTERQGSLKIRLSQNSVSAKRVPMSTGMRRRVQSSSALNTAAYNKTSTPQTPVKSNRGVFKISVV